MVKIVLDVTKDKLAFVKGGEIAFANATGFHVIFYVSEI